MKNSTFMEERLIAGIVLARKNNAYHTEAALIDALVALKDPNAQTKVQVRDVIAQPEPILALQSRSTNITSRPKPGCGYRFESDSDLGFSILVSVYSSSCLKLAASKCRPD